MTPETLGWVFDHVVIPAASAIGGGLFTGRRLRRTIRVQRLTEEEFKAYDQVLSDLKLLRRNAEANRRYIDYRLDNPMVPVSAWDEDDKKLRQRGAEFTRPSSNSGAAAIGPIDLSKGAIAVLRAFIAQVDSPDSIGYRGEVLRGRRIYGAVYWRLRRSPLGSAREMRAITWWCRRKWRAARARVGTSWHLRMQERSMRRWQKEQELKRLQGEVPQPRRTSETYATRQEVRWGHCERIRN